MSDTSPVSIPESQYPALLKLSNLSTEEIEVVTTALEAAPLRFYEADLVAYLAPKVRIPKEDIRAVISVVSSLSVLRSLMEAEPDEFSRNIVAGMGRRKEYPLADAARDRLIGALSGLLRTKAISTPSKAKSLLRSFDNVLCRARTLTDLRPIFGDTADTIDAMVVVHSVNITFHHGTELRDFFVTLDNGDLDLFIAMLQRAKAKAETLKRSVVAPAAIPMIDIE